MLPIYWVDDDPGVVLLACLTRVWPSFRVEAGLPLNIFIKGGYCFTDNMGRVSQLVGWEGESNQPANYLNVFQS